MTLKHVQPADAEQRFESEVRASRLRMPDSAATDAEDTLESLSRCMATVLSIKARTCRGDDSAAVELVVAKDSAYTMRVELEAALRKLEKGL